MIYLTESLTYSLSSHLSLILFVLCCWVSSSGWCWVAAVWLWHNVAVKRCLVTCVFLQHKRTILCECLTDILGSKVRFRLVPESGPCWCIPHNALDLSAHHSLRLQIEIPHKQLFVAAGLATAESLMSMKMSKTDQKQKFSNICNEKCLECKIKFSFSARIQVQLSTEQIPFFLLILWMPLQMDWSNVIQFFVRKLWNGKALEKMFSGCEHMLL